MIMLWYFSCSPLTAVTWNASYRSTQFRLVSYRFKRWQQCGTAWNDALTLLERVYDCGLTKAGDGRRTHLFARRQPTSEWDDRSASGHSKTRRFSLLRTVTSATSGNRIVFPSQEASLSQWRSPVPRLNASSSRQSELLYINAHLSTSSAKSIRLEQIVVKLQFLSKRSIIAPTKRLQHQHQHPKHNWVFRLRITFWRQ